jgi:hypothetical protein
MKCERCNTELKIKNNKESLMCYCQPCYRRLKNELR